MNYKKTVILGIIFALCLIAFLVYNSSYEAWQKKIALSAFVFANADSAKTFVLEKDDVTLRLEKSLTGGWSMLQPVTSAVDSNYVANFFANLRKLKKISTITPENDEYDAIREASGIKSGGYAQLSFAGKKITVGGQTPSASGFYIAIAGDTNIYISSNELSDLQFTSPADFRDKTVFAPLDKNATDSVIIQLKKNKLTLIKIGTRWIFEYSQDRTAEMLPASTHSVETYLSRIFSVPAMDFLAESFSDSVLVANKLVEVGNIAIFVQDRQPDRVTFYASFTHGDELPDFLVVHRPSGSPMFLLPEFFWEDILPNPLELRDRTFFPAVDADRLTLRYPDKREIYAKFHDGSWHVTHKNAQGIVDSAYGSRAIIDNVLRELSSTIIDSFGDCPSFSASGFSITIGVGKDSAEFAFTDTSARNFVARRKGVRQCIFLPRELFSKLFREDAPKFLSRKILHNLALATVVELQVSFPDKKCTVSRANNKWFFEFGSQRTEISQAQADEVANNLVSIEYVNTVPKPNDWQNSSQVMAEEFTTVYGKTISVIFRLSPSGKLYAFLDGGTAYYEVNPSVVSVVREKLATFIGSRD